MPDQLLGSFVERLTLVVQTRVINAMIIVCAVLVSLACGTRLLAAPIVPRLEKHGIVAHGPVVYNTSYEFYDDATGGREVTGMVVGVSFAPTAEAPVVGFIIRVTVTNNSGFNWTDYVFAFEYAQHRAEQWADEGFGIYGPQPVMTQVTASVYTRIALPAPAGGFRTEVPGRARGALAHGMTDEFDQAFTIDGNGAPRGTNLYNFLTNFIDHDIHWARSSSLGISDYPESLGAAGLLTRYDNTFINLPNGRPPRNTGPPANMSNVSVFPNIPEPSTLSLLCVASSTFLCFSYMRRKRRPSANARKT
jgi:hypothetical protein